MTNPYLDGSAASTFQLYTSLQQPYQTSALTEYIGLPPKNGERIVRVLVSPYLSEIAKADWAEALGPWLANFILVRRVAIIARLCLDITVHGLERPEQHRKTEGRLCAISFEAASVWPRAARRTDGRTRWRDHTSGDWCRAVTFTPVFLLIPLWLSLLWQVLFISFPPIYFFSNKPPLPRESHCKNDRFSYL